MTKTFCDGCTTELKLGEPLVRVQAQRIGESMGLALQADLCNGCFKQVRAVAGKDRAPGSWDRYTDRT